MLFFHLFFCFNIDYYEKRIESLKADSTKAKKYDELEAKFKYNEGITETIKNNINDDKFLLLKF